MGFSFILSLSLSLHAQQFSLIHRHAVHIICYTNTHTSIPTTNNNLLLYPPRLPSLRPSPRILQNGDLRVNRNKIYIYIYVRREKFASVHFTYDADGAGANRRISNLLTISGMTSKNRKLVRIRAYIYVCVCGVTE